MNQENNKTKNADIDSEALQKKEIKSFVFVMIVFTIGMAILLLNKVSAWWIWYIYFIIWTLVEVKIAKNIKLKWWWWLIIITIIVLIDFLILELVG